MQDKTPITFGEELRSLATPAFRLLETRHAQGLLVPPHEHEHGCVNFVLAGCYREDVGRLEGAFAPLTCFYKPPGAPHRNRFTDAPARCLLIELRQADLAAPGTDLARPATSRGPGAVRAALALWRELAAPDACSSLVAEQLALEVVEDTLAEGAAVAERSARVNAARATLHDDPRQPWTLSSLALHVGLHPSHLARAFRAPSARGTAARSGSICGACA